jgi:PAS domain S-box-containing protein
LPEGRPASSIFGPDFRRDCRAEVFTADFRRRILDLAPDALVIADAAGSIVFANDRITALFGYRPEELVGAPVESLMPGRFRARHVGHRRSFESNPRARAMGSGLELLARRKDGSEFPVEISLGPIMEGDRPLVVASIRDSTDRQLMQARLRQATEDAERANEAKSRFLATASHDLRQPVQTLGLLAGTLRRITADSQTLELLDQAEHAIGAMSSLLNALLDISKLESGAIKPKLSEFSVAALLEELRADFASIAASKGLRLEIEPCADGARSDPSLVGQAMRNLVANAIKYTHAGSVTLRCRRHAADLRLEVTDTGVGIPAEEIGRICDDFYQVGVPRNSTREGFGLGLSIVSRIAILLGLKLEIRSQPGKGSVFSLEMPAAEAPEVSAASRGSCRPVVPGSAARARILLVEDDPGVLNATRMLLRVEGHEVLAASSQHEAVKQVAEHPDIGLLISDYHLAQNETGLQVVAAVRDATGQDLKAILVTGDTSSAMHALANDSNLRAVNKPINADELLALVNEFLGPR